MLDAVGWDVGAEGLTGAPPVRVLVGEQRHVTVDRALRLLGLGAPTVVAADSQGRLVPDALREALGEGPTIVCAQAGEVNTGAFDPLPEIADACEAGRRVAARRRRLRDLGRRLAAAAPPRRRASSAPTPGRPTRTSG